MKELSKSYAIELQEELEKLLPSGVKWESFTVKENNNDLFIYLHGKNKIALKVKEVDGNPILMRLRGELQSFKEKQLEAALMMEVEEKY